MTYTTVRVLKPSNVYSSQSAIQETLNADIYHPRIVAFRPAVGEEYYVGTGTNKIVLNVGKSTVSPVFIVEYPKPQEPYWE